MKGLTGKIEVIIALVLVGLFIAWSSSKCRETTERPATESGTAIDSLENATAGDSPDGVLADGLRQKIAERAAADSLAAIKAEKTATPAPGEAYSQLYITIDKLKIRDKPGLKSKVLGELKLFDKVYFMEEVTDSSYQVNLGKEMANEPYVKVKTKRGTVGWVYGAGVHYHKKKREGVE